MKKQLRRIQQVLPDGRELLECGHIQEPRRNSLGYGISFAVRRECDACHDEEAEREGARIAAFGGPRAV